jgi:hypothetical protein
MKRYKYYQPNKKDLKDDYGDCVIRAICKAMGITWIEAFDISVEFSRENQCWVSGMPLVLLKKFFSRLGFTYNGISNKKGSKRPTVEGFAKDHKSGTYILSVANHLVTVVDGYYYDTWDCGDKSLYGYYEKVGGEK